MAELACVLTPIDPAELARALRDAFAGAGLEVTEELVVIAVAQSAGETFRWRLMRGWNLGNRKATDDYVAAGGTFQYYLEAKPGHPPVTEILSRPAKEAAETVSGPRREGEGPDMVVLEERADGTFLCGFWAPHPQARFRAFASLEAGVADWTELLLGRYRSALEVAVAGDVAAYCRELRARGYFTDDVDHYRRGVDELAREFAPRVAAALRPQDAPPEPRPLPPGLGSNAPHAAILAAQWCCALEGIDPGPLDGDWGPRTKGAIEAFAHRDLKPAISGGAPAALAALPISTVDPATLPDRGALVSDPDRCRLLELGGSPWLELDDGWRVAKAHAWDDEHGCWARWNHSTMEAWARARGGQTATAAQILEAHARSHFVAPITSDELGLGKITQHDLNVHMRSARWCVLHDQLVVRALVASGWDGSSAIPNTHKGWEAHGGQTGWIFGWFTAPAPSIARIQNESARHRTDLAMTDYGTSGWIALAPGATWCEPAAPHDWRDDLAGLALEQLDPGLRLCAWLGWELGQGLVELPGPARDDPRILELSAQCRRGGVYLGVDEQRRALWRGGAPLALRHDEDPWCAATASGGLCATALPGEAPPHGLRVSGREIVEDAGGSLRKGFVPPMNTGMARPVDGSYTPMPGDLAIYRRAGEDPRLGGKSHVVTVLGLVGHDRFKGIGGNEQNALRYAVRPLQDPDLVVFVRRSRL